MMAVPSVRPILTTTTPEPPLPPWSTIAAKTPGEPSDA